MSVITRLGITLLCAVGALAALLWMVVESFVGGERYWRLARGFDQTAGTTFGGHEDITISTRAGLAQRRGARWGCVLCRLLDRVDSGHCDRAVRENA